MNSLDKLATAVKTLTVQIVECDESIDILLESRVAMYKQRGELIHQAFGIIELNIPRHVGRPQGQAKIVWCKKAGISIQTARNSRRIFLSVDPTQTYERMRKSESKV